MKKWLIKKMSEVTCLVTDGKHGDCDNQEDSGYFFLSSKDLRNGRLQYDRPRQINYEGFIETHRRTNLKPGDILLTNCGASIGRVGIAQNDSRILRTTFQKSISVIKANHEVIDNLFLYYFLVLNSTLLIRLGNGAAQPNLLIGDIKRIEVPVPPMVVQRRIATILSTYDDLIQNNTRRIKILEEVAQTIYREWFVSFRFPGHEKVNMVDSPLGKIPEGWEICTVKDEIELCYGKALKSSNRKEGPFPVFGSSGVIGSHSAYLVEAPGIVVGRKGNVGSVHWSDIDFFPIDTAYYVKTDLSLFYVFYNLQHQNFINNDAAVPGLNRNQAYSLPFVKPLSGTLMAFDELCAPLFRQLRALDNKNKNLRETCALLLPRLISGAIDMSDLEVEIPIA